MGVVQVTERKTPGASRAFWCRLGKTGSADRRIQRAQGIGDVDAAGAVDVLAGVHAAERGAAGAADWLTGLGRCSACVGAAAGALARWPVSLAESLNTATACTSSAACVRKLLAAAAISSTNAAFCCVAWSICCTASPI